MICKWADDSRRFILEHFDIIQNSPSAIYHYAIPFSPSSSWLHKYYSPELLQRVKVIKGLQARWGICSRTVSFNDTPQALSCWKDLIAVGLCSGDIFILDAVTGVYTSILSCYNNEVNSLAFSFDGKFLVSGSDKNTVNLWNIQTGRIIKTFNGHTQLVWSVSISLDCTVIASGSQDHTIRLWNVQTGECHCVIGGHNNEVNSVSFSPINPKLLISASDDNIVRQWDVDGHQIGSTYKGEYVVFSSDGTHFVSWRGEDAKVQDFNSGVIIAELKAPGSGFQCCCLSPGGKSMAGSDGHTLYIWDITSLGPCLVETLTGHTDDIISLTFSSSLISLSEDKSIKFWQTNASSVDQGIPDSESTSLAPVSIRSVSLQPADGIAISSDSAGVIKTWDILTGKCKDSFQTPAKGDTQRDAQLIGGRIICVWLEDGIIHIWDTEKQEHLQIPSIQSIVNDLRISGDGLKIYLLGKRSIQAQSIWTGEVVGEVELEGEALVDSLIVDGSRVWVFLINLQTQQGWDFGIPDSTPIPLPNISPDKPHLAFFGTMYQGISPSRVEDIVTRKEVFQLFGRYAKPYVAQLDGQYLIAGYKSGEVLILDLKHMISQ